MHVFYVWLWLSAHDSRNYEYWVVAVAGSFSLDGVGAHDVDCGVDVAVGVGDDVAFFVDEHPFIGRIFIFIEDWKLEERTNSISMVVNTGCVHSIRTNILYLQNLWFDKWHWWTQTNRNENHKFFIAWN